MNSILVSYHLLDPATILTTAFFRQFGEWAGIRVTCEDIFSVTKEKMNNCDIFVLIRPQHPLCYALQKNAKKMGKLTGVMLDDDFFEIPDYKTRRPVQKTVLSKTIRIADILFSTNDSLGHKMERMSSKGVFVRIDVPVDETEMHPYSGNKSDDIKIAYYVNDGNPGAIEGVINPVIPVLNKKYKDKLKWYFIGLSKKVRFDEKPLDYTIVDKMSIDAFKKYLQEEGFDIGIAPLVDSSFNKAKYVNKLIEYTMAGIPAIYSNVEPYKSTVQPGEMGILANNDPQSWEEAFDKMINCDRAEFVSVIQKAIIRNYGIEDIGRTIIETYPDIKTYESKRKKISGLNWNISTGFSKAVNLSDYPLRATGRIREEGIRSTVAWIKARYM